MAPGLSALPNSMRSSETDQPLPVFRMFNKVSILVYPQGYIQPLRKPWSPASVCDRSANDSV
jgi:hypothetical protein